MVFFPREKPYVPATPYLPQNPPGRLSSPLLDPGGKARWQRAGTFPQYNPLSRGRRSSQSNSAMEHTVQDELSKPVTSFFLRTGSPFARNDR